MAPMQLPLTSSLHLLPYPLDLCASAWLAGDLVMIGERDFDFSQESNVYMGESMTRLADSLDDGQVGVKGRDRNEWVDGRRRGGMRGRGKRRAR